MASEHDEAVNLRDLVAQTGPLPLEEAINYTLQVAEDLASQRGVVHRDIKPCNILVLPDGRAKLFGTGLARPHQPSIDLMATSVTLETFDYISPELARDPSENDVRSDLYSLGCTFHYMLTGMPPFPEGTVLQKLLSHSGESPPDPRDVRPDLPKAVSAIARKLMVKLPSQRYQTPQALMNDLVMLAERSGLRLNCPMSSDRNTPKRFRPRFSVRTLMVVVTLPWRRLTLLVASVFALVVSVGWCIATWRSPQRFIFLPGGDVGLGFRSHAGWLQWIEYAPWDRQNMDYPWWSLPWGVVIAFLSLLVTWQLHFLRRTTSVGL